jgi:hypothetical protein
MGGLRERERVSYVSIDDSKKRIRRKKTEKRAFT